VRVALIRRLSDLGVSETTWRLTRHRLRIAGHDVLGTPISILQADGTQTSNTTQSSGRRAQLLRVESMGRRGNPLDRSWLISQLTRTTDPGHGFALRGAASRSLGRLGDPSAAGALIAAFHDEARHIGTPGAGLGIQRPVRLDVLWALGEIGNPAAGNLLVGALTSDEPAATKPIWHEAALALYKLGSHIEPLLRRSSHERAQRLATLL
jgi:hypothetical protein